MSLRKKVEDAIMERKRIQQDKLLSGTCTIEEYKTRCGHLRGLDEALSVFGEVYRSAIKDGHTDPDED